MRICLFTPTFLPKIGGAEKDADLLASSLTRRGHDVQVLTQRSRRRKMPMDLPYPVHQYRRPPSPHLWPEVLALPLYRRYRRWPFDVCLAFYSFPTGYAASVLRRWCNFKIVTSPLGGDLYDNFHLLNKPRVRSVVRQGYRRADRLVAISHWVVDRLGEVVGPPLPPIDMVYTGIDLDEVDDLRTQARAQPPELPVRKPFVLQLARLAKVKNQPLAVEAVARLKDTFRARNLQYVIAGQGKVRAQLEQQIAEHDLHDIVQLIGSRTGVEKTWLLDNAEFFVTTSREEAFGIVQIEAMAHGLPLLASRIGAHRELLRDQDWGRLFESDHVDDLTDKMRQMLETDRAPMRAVAMQRRSQFSLKYMIDGYERACYQALDADLPAHLASEPPAGMETR